MSFVMDYGPLCFLKNDMLCSASYRLISHEWGLWLVNRFKPRYHVTASGWLTIMPSTIINNNSFQRRKWIINHRIHSLLNWLSYMYFMSPKRQSSSRLDYKATQTDTVAWQYPSDEKEKKSQTCSFPEIFNVSYMIYFCIVYDKLEHINRGCVEAS